MAEKPVESKDICILVFDVLVAVNQFRKVMDIFTEECRMKNIMIPTKDLTREEWLELPQNGI